MAARARDRRLRSRRPGHRASQVNEAGERIAAADVQQRGQVTDVGPLGEQPFPGLAGQVVRQRRLPALDHHARLAELEQRPCRMRADKAQASGDQDHDGLQFASVLMIGTENLP